MSLASMNRAFRKHGMAWGIGMGVIMMGGVAFNSFGNNPSRQTGEVSSSGATQTEGEKALATVGSQPVTSRQLDELVQTMQRQQAMMGQMTGQPTPVERVQLRLNALSTVQQEQALIAAAQKAGIQVDDATIAREREKVWQAQRAGYAQTLGLKEDVTDADIDRTLARLQPGMSVERIKTVGIPEDRLKLQVYAQGLEAVAKKQAGVTEADVRRSYNEIKVRHILIASGANGLPEAQAKTKADKILAEVKANPAKMAALADQFSDDPGNTDPKTKKKQGGVYDFTPASRYVPDFTRAALAAGVGKVYPEPVKTPYGYHIIKLEAERPGKDFPKDFDKEKQKYIDQYASRIATQKADELVKAEVPNVKIEVSDPLLRAAQFVEEASKAPSKVAKDSKSAQALAELDKVKKEDDPSGVAGLMRAQLLTDLGRTKDAITAYEQVLADTNSFETRVALAQLYAGQKDKANTLKQLEEAEKFPAPSVQAQFQVVQLYRTAGDAKKSDAAMEKLTELLKRQQAAQQPPITVPPTATATAPKTAASPAPKPSGLPSASASPAPAPSASPSVPVAP